VLPKDVLGRLRAATEALRNQPRPPGAVKLAGTDNLWRIRIGDFRVVYVIADEELVITVVRVANRREVYRGL
jgi:mRNA interferase RelE/StbE